MTKRLSPEDLAASRAVAGIKSGITRSLNARCLHAARDASIRALWEGSDASARQIGQMYGLTRNAVIGLARRRGWAPRRVTCRIITTMERLDELHAVMDGMLE